MAKKFRPTKKQAAVLAKMTTGAVLCGQHGDPPFFFDGGDAVNARTVRCLEAAGKIKLAGDGLLPGFGQTYVTA